MLHIILMGMMALSAGIYLTIMVISLVRFKVVGFHQAVFTCGMLVLMSTHVLGLMEVHNSLHTVFLFVALNTAYHIGMRVAHKRKFL